MASPGKNLATDGTDLGISSVLWDRVNGVRVGMIDHLYATVDNCSR
jgi:hypothetical protein